MYGTNKLLSGCGDAVRRLNPSLFTGSETVDTGKAPIVERNLGNGALGKKKGKNKDRRYFLVRVTAFLSRLCDEDNLCEKYHVDLCRYAGILPSDAPGQTKIEVRQQKVKKGEERVEIEVLVSEES